MKALVVLPTYNEAANIGAVLRRIREQSPLVDVLVIDDGSSDGTADLARQQADALGQISVLERPGKGGLGAAYRDGFDVGLRRGYQILVEMDADLSHDPLVVPVLVTAVKAGADLAIGSRYVPGGSIPDWTWHRRVVSRIGNRYARMMLGITPADSTSGFRAYGRQSLLDANLSGVRADGYGFQIEMAYRIERNGGRIVEIPICVRDRTAGQSKMSTKVVAEALLLVTWWGCRDRLRSSGPRRTSEPQESPAYGGPRPE